MAREWNRGDSMTTKRTSIHGQWSSRMAFFLAAVGSAIGLGNIWKFPYITGENGGGAFVFVYLLCIVAIGIPIMAAEILLGRRGRQNPINTMLTLAGEEGGSGNWRWLGWMGVVAGFLILSYYSVIAGWALAYVFRAAGGMFEGRDAEAISAIFTGLVADPERLLAWHTLFMVMTMIVVARGVRSGLEKAVRLLMPAMFLILLVLVGYAMDTGYFMQGFHFLFDPDFSKITWTASLIAMGHAFFTLSLGMGAIMIYGSYLPDNASIMKSTVAIAAADTVVALLAGLAIFPLVFANGLVPGEGPGLVFKTLPIAFGQMPGGSFFGTLFFMLLVFAAWTSSISLVEPAVTWMVENHGIRRIKATVYCGVLAWLLGIATVLSFNLWSDVAPLSFIAKFEGKTIFDLLDFLTANVMLPLGGLLIALFAGYVMSRPSSADELGMGEGNVYLAWRFLVRYISPVAVAIVFLNVLGVFDYIRESLG
jgi:NSS family neurotransmitter:Na+ symporter